MSCGPAPQLVGIVKEHRRRLAHHFSGGIARHRLGRLVEQRDHALRVGGDDRVGGVIENRRLQLQQFAHRLLGRLALAEVDDGGHERRLFIYLEAGEGELHRNLAPAAVYRK